MSKHRPIRAPRAAGGTPFRIIAHGRRASPHEDVYHFLLVRPWSVFLASAAGLYLGICALFALLYLAVPGSVGGMRSGSFEDAFYFSVQTKAPRSANR